MPCTSKEYCFYKQPDGDCHSQTDCDYWSSSDSPACSMPAVEKYSLSALKKMSAAQNGDRGTTLTADEVDALLCGPLCNIANDWLEGH